MKGSGYHILLFVFAMLAMRTGFSEQQEQDSLSLSIKEPIPLIYLVDSLSINQADNAPLFFERLPKSNSETLFGSPHLLNVVNFEELPLTRPEGSEWFFLVVFFSLLLSACSFVYFPYYSRQFFRSVADTVMFKKIKKEKYFENRTPKWMLSANFLVVVALMVALTTAQPSLFGFDFDFIFIARFGLALSLVSILFFLKRGLERFFSWVFGQKRVLEIHQDTTFFFNNLTGVVILPFVLVYYYNPHLISFNFLWNLLIIAFLIKIVRRALVWFRNSNLPLFYIILYLCGVELAPLLLVYKIVATTIIGS